ncbi:phosphonate transport system substrate-binding protein [Noviherbaspirillum suwonense]|jgi:phosphonate transport system substrate-binding protein|uniref:Phosphonate transport system substrate-binding protein n=2 Tax=Noviherbaspirillum suwonense TaxID=1224511 RepID=A0ABY1QKZ7_9BURK|nr:phosphonate transport system substrate-binding protein [Noviherbaspirillum suwonense]
MALHPMHNQPFQPTGINTSMPIPNASRRLFTASLLLGAAVAAMAARPANAENASYQFSPVNQYGIELTAQYWNPIIDYVSKKAGVQLRLKIGRTSADTTAYVLANEVDFVFTNHLFSPERDKLGWRTVARRNTPPIHSQILVLEDSPIKSLEQLADQSVVFPGPEALVAYKYSYAQLLNRKIPVHVGFSGNHDGAFAQLVSGKAQAVGANSQLGDGWSRREGRKLRVLWQSEALHDLALMVSKNVPDNHLHAVQRAFVEMGGDPEGRKILATASELVKLPPSTAFVISTGSEYAAYRSFYQTAPASLR